MTVSSIILMAMAPLGALCLLIFVHLNAKRHPARRISQQNQNAVRER